MTTAVHTEITDEALESLDLAAFNAGENPYDSSSVSNAFRRGVDYYRGVIDRYGFVGNRRVLDLMCGFGRWSLFLSERNEEAVGLDRNQGAISIAQGIAQHFGRSNLFYQTQDIAGTRSFPDGSFDGIWIWNALIYVERGPCLAEAYRLLEPGGRLLVGSTNALGRILEKFWTGLLSNENRRANQRRQAWKCLRSGPLFDGQPNFVTRSTVSRIFGDHGFEIVEVEENGRRVFGRFPRNLDILARKSS